MSKLLTCIYPPASDKRTPELSEVTGASKRKKRTGYKHVYQLYTNRYPKSLRTFLQRFRESKR